ncbi:rCG43728, isoform CRA_a [Rattus norvegicus]|uniref:RCG43728, isoform CRA_a n=1 Tax=Rattus norvegicus TaxID=10116 RepID=A6JIM2_RAT|nr:rCG43728, isoform CRA_a [Rattus norvegicus]
MPCKLTRGRSFHRQNLPSGDSQGDTTSGTAAERPASAPLQAASARCVPDLQPPLCAGGPAPIATTLKQASPSFHPPKLDLMRL